MTETIMEKENLEKTDEPDVFEFSIASVTNFFIYILYYF